MAVIIMAAISRYSPPPSAPSSRHKSGADEPRNAPPAPLISYPKRRTVFRPHLGPVVEACGGDVGVAQPFLELGDIRLNSQAHSWRLPIANKSPTLHVV